MGEQKDIEIKYQIHNDMTGVMAMDEEQSFEVLIPSDEIEQCESEDELRDVIQENVAQDFATKFSWHIDEDDMQDAIDSVFEIRKDKK